MLIRRIIPWFVAGSVLLVTAVLAGAQTNAPRVQAIRFWTFGDVTRFVIQTEGDYRLRSDQISNPPRLYFDLSGVRPPPSSHKGVETIHVGDTRVKDIRVAPLSSTVTRIVFDLEQPVDAVSSQLVNPDRLVIEIRLKAARSLAALSVDRTRTGAEQVVMPPPPQVSQEPPTVPLEHKSVTQAPLNTVPAPEKPVVIPPAPPATSGRKSDGQPVDRSLVRVFGLKIGRVVIDAGHGGRDTGTIGPGGLQEKDLVLDVAMRVGALITRRLGAEVVYTRSDDTFIPLEERTRIANQQKADLFLSIHANSSPEPSATGVETYYFNLNSDKRGLDLAVRENATASSSISDLNDMLHRAVLETKREESRDFAQQVQTSLWTMSAKMNSHSKDRGVRQAPFVVLIGATMPSILAEVGFVSNPHDEKLLKRSEQRQKIAEALFKGVSQYASSLGRVQVARVGQ